MSEFLNNLLSSLGSFAVTAGARILGALAVYIIGAIIIKAFIKNFPRDGKHKSLDPTAKSFIKSFLQIILYALLIVIVISILGVPTSSVVSVIASAGVTVGLALQGSLANFAGGLMILIYRPFKLGDFIECGSGTGTVFDVGTFYTVLKTPDNKHIVVPNGALSNSPITNYSVEKNRRVDIVFSVGYGTELKKAYDAINSVISECDNILTDPAPFVRLTSLGESSVDITVRLWCEQANFFGVKFEMLEKVYDKFNKEGIEIPFPQLSVHFDEKKESNEK